MLKKLIAAISLILLLNFTLTNSVFSQDKEIRDAEKYKTRVAKRRTGGNPIVVKLKDNSKFKGVINEIKDDYFVLVNNKSGASPNIYYRQVKDIDKAFSTTEKTIATVGAGLGFTFIIVCFVARKCVD